MTSYKELLAMVHPAVRDGTNKSRFAPKLDHNKRCAALALTKIGFDQKVVAEFFGLHRRTMSLLVNYTSPHYKSVRAELVGLGEEAFIARYVTPTILTQLNDRVSKQVAERQSTAPPPNSPPTGPNRKANTRQGTFFNETAGWTFEIAWDDDPEFTGWGYRIVDQNTPLLGKDGKPFLTSGAAYNFAKDQPF